MEKKLNDYLKNLEQKLMNADSRDEAYDLVKNYDKESLLAIQSFLKAYTKSKSRHAILASIVKVTYEAHNRHKIITDKK